MTLEPRWHCLFSQFISFSGSSHLEILRRFVREDRPYKDSWETNLKFENAKNNLTLPSDRDMDDILLVLSDTSEFLPNTI